VRKVGKYREGNKERKRMVWKREVNQERERGEREMNIELE